jgi:membrane associated rhomboid family serine protease
VLPLKDDIQSPRAPVATLVLIAVLVGLAISSWQPDLAGLPWPVAAVLASVLTAGIFQLFVNGLFLWLFAKSVEGSLGPIGLVGVYLLGALAAAGTGEVIGDWSVPATGGAGAIAAVIGAHCVLFPRARIVCFVLIPFFFTFVLLPASVLALTWVGLQVIPAVGDTAGAAFPGDPGISAAALAGGFVAGAVVAGLVRARAVARFDSGQPAF